MSTDAAVELRCPAHYPRLLAKLLDGSGRAIVEIACKHCSGKAGPGRTVVHRFSTADGAVVATRTIEASNGGR